MPSSVSRSINSSGASVTRAALVPSAHVIGTRTGVTRVLRIVSTKPSWPAASLMSRSSHVALVACRMQGKDVGNRAVERSGYAYGFTQLHHASRQPTHSKPISTLQIVVHRRGHILSHIVREREAMLGIIGGQIDSLAACHGNEIGRASCRERV